MPATTLSHASRWNPGSDLWVVPEYENSKSTQLLDWYLNFQLTKASLHSASTRHEELDHILNLTGLESPVLTAKNDKLLISSQQLLPCRWTLQVSNSNKFTAWVEQVSDSWLQLRKPSLRIFLPKNKELSDFLSIWNKVQAFDDFTVVID